MTTVRDLITDSLSEIGVLADGQTASAGDAALSLRRLNDLIDSWGLDRLQIYTITRHVVAIVANVAEYLLGSGDAESFANGLDEWTEELTGDATAVVTGDTSVALTVTVAGTADFYQDFTCPSGEETVLSLFANHGFNPCGTVSVQNTVSGNYLTATGEWQTAAADVFTVNSPISSEYTTTFDIEGATELQALETTLRIQFSVADSPLNSATFQTFSLTFPNQLEGVPRPPSMDRIDHVNLVYTSNTPNTEVELAPLTEDEWASVTQKDATSTQPGYWFYNPTYPLGTLTVWPVPTGSDLSLAIYAPEQVEGFSDLDRTVLLPPGYKRMIVKNLALELCPAFDKQPSPLLVQQASQSMGAVKRVNRRVADLSFDAGALIGSRYRFNIYTGR